jgi:hypothetical protein
MKQNFYVIVFAAGLLVLVGNTTAFAQFGGRSGGMGGIFGGSPRGGRSGSMSNQGRPTERPMPDSHEQTEQRLALMESDLRLSSEQQEPWRVFAQKVRAYASDLSRERARIGLPLSEAAPANGVQQIDKVIESERNRVNELEAIRTATDALYATLSADQKKTADTRIQSIFSPGSLPPRRDNN